MADDLHHGHPDGVPVPRPGPDDPSDLVDETLSEVLWRSRELGFLGQGGIGAHVRNARAFVAELGPARRVVDLGSGGGVPGLVVAVDRPGMDLVLVEAAQRRVDFLVEAVEELGLTRHVVIEHGRAEELARRPDLRGLVRCGHGSVVRHTGGHCGMCGRIHAWTGVDPPRQRATVGCR